MASQVEETLKHAMLLARHLHKCDLQYAVVAVLLELGFPTNREGFDYLRKSVMVFCDNPAQALSKGIYLAVAKQYDPEPSVEQIEQAIRAVIDVAWKDRDEELWRLYFLAKGKRKLKKPSNSEFISGIGFFMELWRGCCQEVEYERTK